MKPKGALFPSGMLLIALALVACGGGGGGGGNATSPPAPISRASVDGSGAEGNGGSGGSAISADGRDVAFASDATNLVAGDTNATGDIFVHDTQSGATTRVSVDATGVEADANSFRPHMSGDGRHIVFYSHASNLVTGDTNAVSDIFVHDIQSGVTTRVSVDSNGAQANGASVNAALSADGRFVAFESRASNLVAADTNSRADIFVHDTQTGVTTRVSVDSNGVQGTGFSYAPAISADGRHVAFESTSALVSADTDPLLDIYVHDTQTGVTAWVTVNAGGVGANFESYAPALSADGRYVAFYSDATNLVADDTNGKSDIFVRDTQSGATTRVSVDASGGEANGDSRGLALSADGRHVAFGSDATNLVAGDLNGVRDVFVHDRDPDGDGIFDEPGVIATTRVSVDASGAEANGDSGGPALSADGRYVAFASGASDLVAGDLNGVSDIFRAPAQ